MMTGQLVWERVMAEAVNPKALGLGDRPVAGEVAGRAGLAGRGARARMGEVDDWCGALWLLLVVLVLVLVVAWVLALLAKKKVRESARRMGDLVACAAAALLGRTGLRGGVSASQSAGKALPVARAEEETKVGEETKRVPEEAEEEADDEEEEAKEEAIGVAGEGVVLR